MVGPGRNDNPQVNRHTKVYIAAQFCRFTFRSRLQASGKSVLKIDPSICLHKAWRETLSLRWSSDPANTSQGGTMQEAQAKAEAQRQQQQQQQRQQCVANCCCIARASSASSPPAPTPTPTTLTTLTPSSSSSLSTTEFGSGSSQRSSDTWPQQQPTLPTTAPIVHSSGAASLPVVGANELFACDEQPDASFAFALNGVDSLLPLPPLPPLGW